MATEIDADAAYQSCEDDAEERHPEWHEAWEQEVVDPHDGGESRDCQGMSADLPPETDDPADNSHCCRAIENTHAPRRHEAMILHSKGAGNVAEEIGNERNLAILTLAQCPMANYLELIKQPDSQQRDDEGVEHHFKHHEHADTQWQDEHRSEETDERDAIGEHCHRMAAVADCLK